MPAIHLSALFGILLVICCYLGFFPTKETFGKEKIIRSNLKIYKYLSCLLFISALLLRLLAGLLSEGFGTDLSCFAAWAERMHTTGPSGFYSPDVFTDYPPGYMYVLWVIGGLRQVLNIPYYSSFHLALLKLPAIICDLVCGWLLYREAAGKFSESKALFLCYAYLFNPVILLNSAVWGQVDSVFTLALILMCLALVKGRLFPAYLSFFIGVLLKPQMLMFSPILLAGMTDQVLLHDFSLRKLGKNLLHAFFSMAGSLCLCLPFGVGNVWKQYFSTVESYPFAAVNACNFWGMLGLNWISQENTFLGIPYKLCGYLFILLIMAMVLIISLRHKDNREKYFFLAAVLILMLFVFSVRMHERYLYPGLILLLFAFIYRPVKAVLFCYGSFSLLHFYNTAFVLFFYDPGNYDRKAPLLLLVSAGMVLTAFVLNRFAVPQYFAVQNAGIAEADLYSVSPETMPDHGSMASIAQAASVPCPSRKSPGPNRADLLWMTAITLIYSCFALYDLGDHAAPESRYDMTGEDTVIVHFADLQPEQKVYSIACYIAPVHNRNFILETRDAGDEDWSPDAQVITFSNVFTWQEFSLDVPGDSVRLTLMDDSASLLELVFLDQEGNVLTPSNASDHPALFDEQSLYPERVSFRNSIFDKIYHGHTAYEFLNELTTYETTYPPFGKIIISAGIAVFNEQSFYSQRVSFRNSMYFDEIYHGRTAYEFLNGLTTYETTHPPLGKIIISAGIAIFGMNPFGWRIAGTLFGIFMVPFIYLFGKKLTENTTAAVLACVLYTFDFMHFTQTRIATIDVYITFFVLLMYYFMYCYYRKSFYDTPLSRTFLPLGACGVCMGLGIACKWTGIYAGTGLAVLFFSVLFCRYREYRYAKAAPEGTSNGISHAYILRVFLPHTVKTLCFCLVFFVGIPALIYVLSYLPFVGYTREGLLTRMLHNQAAMFQYHSTLDATHPYSSPWYEWPVIKRPIWYYSSIVSGIYGEGGLREGISAFGNPLVWWPGIPAALYMLWLWVREKDKTAAFLLIGYLAQYLPWFFVTRITFIYHYFPCVAFVTLIIVHSLMQLKKELSAQGFLALTVLYGTAAFILFLLFYPVLSGQAVDSSYVEHWLRWFDSWVLTAP